MVYFIQNFVRNATRYGKESSTLDQLAPFRRFTKKWLRINHLSLHRLILLLLHVLVSQNCFFYFDMCRRYLRELHEMYRSF